MNRDTFSLFQGGGIAINVVDNLMVAHHQASGTSATFDVALKGESDGHISHHKPIGEPIKIHHPTSLTATASSSDKSTSGLATNSVTFYMMLAFYNQGAVSKGVFLKTHNQSLRSAVFESVLRPMRLVRQTLSCPFLSKVLEAELPSLSSQTRNIKTLG